MDVPRIAAMLTLAWLAACTPTPAPEAAAPADRGEVEFYDYRPPNQQVGEISARFDDGSGERVVPPTEFHARDFGFPSSGRLRTRTAGTMRVTTSIRHEGALSEGSFEVPLRSDWRYGIAFHLTSGSAPEGCMGCMGGKAIPLVRPIGSNTTLFIAWGGNSISRPLPH